MSSGTLIIAQLAIKSNHKKATPDSVKGSLTAVVITAMWGIVWCLFYPPLLIITDIKKAPVVVGASLECW